MSVFSDLKPRNRASRNAFDLSRRSVFSTKAGQILPVFVQPTLPSSHYRLDMQQLLRTQPLQTAAFTGFSINYDFVFVPLNHLYSSFNQFIAQRENKNLANQPSYQSVPTFNLSNFLLDLLPYAVYDYYMAQVPYASWIGELQDNRLEYSSLHNSTCVNFSSALEIIRNLDLLGYGNFLPLVKECAVYFNKYLVSHGFVTNYFYENYSYFLDNMNDWCMGVSSFSQFLHDLGVTFIEFLNDAPSDYSFYPRAYVSDLKSPSLWPVLAYNKCFYEFYRNTYYDKTHKNTYL